MKITTFNCNSIRSRMEIILGYLDKNRPDILALQETKVQDDQFPAADLESAGWNVVFSGQKQYNGVAIISSHPADEVSFGLQDRDKGESNPRLALATFDNINLLNTYVPQGADLESEKFQFKIKWLKRLIKFLQKRFDPKKDRLVWVGDLNIAPDPMDVHDHKRIWPHVCHCREMTDIYNNFIEWGFVDIFRKHLPNEGNFTFWDYRVRDSVGRNLGWRIDHILATPIMAKASKSVKVDIEARKLEKPSDHTFVTAEFDL